MAAMDAAAMPGLSGSLLPITTSLHPDGSLSAPRTSNYPAARPRWWASSITTSTGSGADESGATKASASPGASPGA